MPQALEMMQAGATYRVEVDGIIVGEFVAPRSREVMLAGAGSVFLSKIPPNIPRDTYTARPPAPGWAFKRQGTNTKWHPGNWTALLEQGRGKYVARFEDLGDVLVQLDPE